MYSPRYMYFAFAPLALLTAFSHHTGFLHRAILDASARFWSPSINNEVLEEPRKKRVIKNERKVIQKGAKMTSQVIE